MKFEWSDSALPVKLWQKAQEHGPELTASSPLLAGDIVLRDGCALRPSDIVCRALVYQARRLIAMGEARVPALVLDARAPALIFWEGERDCGEDPIDPEKELTWNL